MKINLFQHEVVKRGLQEHVIEFTIRQKPHFMKMSELIEIIEQKSKKEKEFIHRNIRQMNLLNLDILEFLEFLAKSHVMELTTTRRGKYESINNH